MPEENQSKMFCKPCNKLTTHNADQIRDFADISCGSCGKLNYLMIRGKIREN